MRAAAASSESTARPRSLGPRSSRLPIPRLAVLLLLFDGARCSSPVELNGTAHFYDTVGTTGEGLVWFVNFYAPWCGHCKALEADWTALAMELQGSSTGVARVDATTHTELAALYQVEGFPSLQLFSGGRVFSYAGERSLSAMRAFAQGGFKGDLHAQPMPSRPSLLDPLLRLPRGVADVLEVATLTRPLAGALLAAGLFALGALTAMACRRPEFIMVHAPPGASAGQHFAIELPGRWRSRRMTVAAPPGVVAGQPFFVPLTKPLVARHGIAEPEEKKHL